MHSHVPAPGLDLLQGSHPPRIRITPDTASRGRPACVRLLLRARVKMPEPLHAERCLWEHTLPLGSEPSEIEVPLEALGDAYARQGRSLDVLPVLQLKVGAAQVAERVFEADAIHALQPPARPERAGSAEAMAPPDHWTLAASLRALPAAGKLKVVALLLAQLLFWVVNPLVGWHDQRAPERQAIFYDKRGESGPESPLVKALILSVLLGSLSTLAMRTQLRRYLALALKPHPPLHPGLRLRLADLIEGQSWARIRGATLRVVAGNCERGERKWEGVHSKRRPMRNVTPFCEPFNAVILYQRCLDLNPSGAPIDSLLHDEVDFSPMFRALLPPLEIGARHGIGVIWRVQLLHPALADLTVDGSSEGLRYADFVSAR